MKIIDLAGKWGLSNEKKTLSVPVSVPGDSHSALLAEKKISNPYWADNDLSLSELSLENWIYERKVDVPPDFLDQDTIFLELEGVDTLSRVLVNGQLLGLTQNAFVRYRFDAKHVLRPGQNTVRIEIASAEKAAAEQAKKLPYAIPHFTFPIQSKHRNLIRKAQCHSGWDWGPCLMVSGIEAARFIGHTPDRIESVRIVQHHSKEHGRPSGPVILEIFCDVISAQGGSTEFAVDLEGKAHLSSIELRPGSNALTKRIEIPEPRLWWPNGQGAQPLYSLVIRIGADEVQRRIGLRTIEVVNRDDEAGLSLEFHVNGRPIFAKGANWIPADALPQRVTREVLDDLLSSAAAANMNMLRVWGGGRYESDAFYDLCDEKGLLVWQDFMFSCALYPATPEFLANVREEARWQVTRLRDRACLALWCGNNEDLGALTWFAEPKANRDRYLVDYDRLNEGVVGATVRELDPERVFWPSSPCGGPGDYSDCWHDDARGDMHFWNVWAEGKPFEDYLTIKPRFCSEFGYQSFPSLSTVSLYASPDQWNVSAPVMEHHQRSAAGNARIVENMTRYFRYPEGFGNFLFLSQVQQGLAIKTAVEHFRRLRPHCMGALYWQLNDMWPTASWSSLEYGGKWKALHYMARRFFDDLLITALRSEDGQIEIWVDCDIPVEQSMTAMVQVRVIEFSGRILNSVSFGTEIASPASTRLRSFSPEDLKVEDPKGCFIFVDLTVGERTVSNQLFLANYKSCILDRPEITLSIESEKDDTLSIRLNTDCPAFFVTLDRNDLKGEFDDNVITLLPGEPRTIRFITRGKEKIDIEELKKKLEVKHLRQTYT